MFEINLIGKPGVQPRHTDATISYFIDPGLKTAAPVDFQEEEIHYPESGFLQRFRPYILAVAGIILVLAVYFIISTRLDQSAGQDAVQLSFQQQITHVTEIFSSLLNGNKLERLVISPDLILMRLSSTDQLGLNMLGMVIEERLHTRCRISGSVHEKSLLSASIPSNYTVLADFNLEVLKNLLQIHSFTQVDDLGYKLLSPVSEDQLIALIADLRMNDLLRFEKISMNRDDTGSYIVEILYNTNLPE